MLVAFWPSRRSVTTIDRCLFTNCYFEANGDYAIRLSGDAGEGPGYVKFEKPHINARNKAVRIDQGGAEFADPFFDGAPLTPGFFHVGADAGTIVLRGYEPAVGSTGLLIDGPGAGQVTRYLTRAAPDGGLLVAGGLIHAGVRRPCCSAFTNRKLSPREVCGSIITNVGQAAENVIVEFPSSADTAGCQFIFVIGAAHPGRFLRLYAPAGGIYFNGAVKCWIEQAAPVIGSAIMFTGVSTDIYGWVATVLNGTWTSNP